MIAASGVIHHATAAVMRASDPQMKARAAELGARIRAEDGLGEAVAAIERLAAQRDGTGYNDAGFRYPVDSELAPDEPPFEGVHVYNPAAEAYVPRDAFERLVGRWLRAVAVVAERRAQPGAAAAQLRATADRIEARLRDEAARG